jgi:malate dehydrogenase
VKLSILGAAGYVGSNTAFYLAIQGLADEIVLIDPYKENFVLHTAMDLNTAAVDTGTLVRAGGYNDIDNSHIIIVAAGAVQGLISSRMEMLPKNLPIVQDIATKIKTRCKDAIVITVANPIDPLNYAMYLASQIERHQSIGYSRNDSTRFRMLVAENLGVDTRRVAGLVIGEHGESQVLLFSSVKVDGKPVSIDNSSKQKILAKVPDILRGYEELRTGRTAGLTCAVGLAALVSAIKNNTNEVIPCSAVLEGEYGCHGLGMSIPAILGREGIHEILELELAPDENEGLKHSINTLKPAMHYVEEYLGIS